MKGHFEISHPMLNGRCKISSFGSAPPCPALLFTSAETVDGERETLIFTGDFYLPTKPEQLSQSGRVSSSESPVTLLV